MKLEFHFNDLPSGVLIELNPDVRRHLCKTAISVCKYKSKGDLGKILNIPSWKARRLINCENRFPVQWLEKLMRICASKFRVGFSVEMVEKNIKSIGLHSDNRFRIYNPTLPFKLKDLVYVWSHLVFDGSATPKSGSYFMVPQHELLKYHENKLQVFGDVPTNLIEKEKQLYIPWTLVYIVIEIFKPNSFRSLDARVPNMIKNLAIKFKEIADEIIKAALIDEGWIYDKINFGIANEKLSRDVWEITKAHYKVGRFPTKPRTRIGISGKCLNDWKWTISNKSADGLFNSIKPLPIPYKNETLNFIIRRHNRSWYKRKPGETKSLIIKSLLRSPKTSKELAFELDIMISSISNLINGVHSRSQNTTGLKELGIIGIIGHKNHPACGAAGRSLVYGIIDKKKANNFLETNKNEYIV